MNPSHIPTVFLVCAPKFLIDHKSISPALTAVAKLELELFLVEKITNNYQLVILICIRNYYSKNLCLQKMYRLAIELEWKPIKFYTKKMRLVTIRVFKCKKQR
jgi:hypothetical protein